MKTEGRPVDGRDSRTDAIHLLALSGFALAQPLYDLLGRNPEFLILHRAEPLDIALLVFALSVLAPAILFATEWAAGRLAGAKARGLTHRFFVGGLVALTVLPVAGGFSRVSGGAVLATAAAAGLTAAAAYSRLALARTFVTVLAPSALIFPALFVLSSPISRLMLPPRVDVPSGVSAARDVPVVVVILDELPLVSLLDQWGEIDRARYPNFFALAHQSYWFRNATAVHGGTHRALPAILTGRYPDPGTLPALTDHPNNLFTLLGGIGEISVVESATRLCPEQWAADHAKSVSTRRLGSLGIRLAIVYLHRVLPRAWHEWIPPIHAFWGEAREPLAARKAWPRLLRRAGLQADRRRVFLDFVAELGSAPTKRLYFLHSLLPHQSWIYLPSGRIHTLTRGTPGVDQERMPRGAYLAAHAWQRHLLQVGMLDGLLGRLLDGMRAAGLYDSSLLIVSADHGIGFTPGARYRSPDGESAAEVLWVPFFVKRPGQTRGEVSDRGVEVIDIFPTITDVLGVPVPWTVDGRSVFEDGAPERRTKLFFDGRKILRNVTRPTGFEEALRRKRELFGSGPWAELFGRGPYPELLGRPVEEGRHRALGGFDTELAFPDLYRDVRLAGSFVPAHVSGFLTGRSDDDELRVAVGVNGVVRALGSAVRTETDRWFLSVMVPETSFRDGENRIEFIVLAGSSDAIGW